MRRPFHLVTFRAPALPHIGAVGPAPMLDRADQQRFAPFAGKRVQGLDHGGEPLGWPVGHERAVDLNELRSIRTVRPLRLTCHSKPESLTVTGTRILGNDASAVPSDR